MFGFILLGVFFVTLICLLATEDGIPFAIPRLALCKFGKHKYHATVGGQKTKKYYCVNCKKPGNYPYLRPIDGEYKVKDNTYKF